MSDDHAFSDPDGNEWRLQEATTRETGVATLAGLLLETSLHHGRFEQAAPAHDWWDWYAPYLDARRRGSTPEQATAAADRQHEEGARRSDFALSLQRTVRTTSIPRLETRCAKSSANRSTCSLACCSKRSTSTISAINT